MFHSMFDSVYSNQNQDEKENFQEEMLERL